MIHVLRKTIPFLWLLLACAHPNPRSPMTRGEGADPREALPRTPYVVVLGTAQDGGFPQAGTKPGPQWNAQRRFAASLAIVDPISGERWLIEATPDFREQLHALDVLAPVERPLGLDGVFLTHAHVGHYAGLIHLGREIFGAKGVPVYGMPRMREFLSRNGPWELLVRLENIALRPLEDGVTVVLNERVRVTPFTVPHRDEYSETVGFRISGPERTVVFLPDIDKWEKWEALGTKIEQVVDSADVAYLDATFYADGEIPGRSMSQIPHPFIAETMQRFGASPPETRKKIHFIHLNHTNPVGTPDSPERRAVEAAGFGVAAQLEITAL
jgi:pyrroloquinoline quinone biosynthesis protein B